MAYLRRAEKLLAKAMDEPGGGISISEMDEYVREENARRNRQEADAEAETAEAGEARRLADVRMSIQEVDGKPIVVIDTDQDIFEGAERSEYGKIVRDYMREHFRGQEVNGIKFTSTSEREFTLSRDSQRLFGRNGEAYETKMRAGTELDNLIQTSTFIRHEEARHPHSYNADGYNRYSVEFIVDNVPFEGQIVVALNGNNAMFYDIVGIKEKEAAQLNRSMPAGVESTSVKDSAKANSQTRDTFEAAESISETSVSTNSIRDNTENVKRNGQKSDTPDIRYSLSAVDDYTEKQYNDYGWVRVNDVLSDREYADFNRKMNNLSAEIRRGKTASGEYIIPVNDMKGERFGVDNVLVFAKGTYQNPKITKVIRIDFEDKIYNNETNLTILREYIYEQERQDNEYASIIEDVYPQAIISRYTKENIPSYQESKIEWRRRSSGNESGGIDGTDREVQDGRGDSRSDQRDVRYSVSQSRDDNYVTNRLKSYTYSDVDKIVENLTINKYGDDVVLRHKGNIGLADFQESIRRQKAEKTYIFISFALRA